MEKTRVNIISGFLGSGKTSFIKKIIKETENIKNTVIIENEFGEIGIDGNILKREGVNVKEINSGCICCSVADDFEKTILGIKKSFNPFRIIVEPSGVGKLSDIVESFRKHSDLFEISALITIVDIKRYFMYLTNFGEFYRDQIYSSDTVVFSRFSEVSESEKKKVIESIRSINKNLRIIDKEWTEFSSLDTIREDDTAETCINKPADSSIYETEKPEKKLLKGDFQSVSVKMNISLSRESLHTMLEKLNSGDYGSVLRAKGNISSGKDCFEFDFVPEEIIIRKSSTETEEHCMVVIGENIDTEKIKTLISETAKKKRRISFGSFGKTGKKNQEK